MESTPPSPGANQFACLSVESINICSGIDPSMTEPVSTPPDVQNPPLPLMPRSHGPLAWEKRLPCKYVVASAPSTNFLRLEVEIETTDTQQTHQVVALLNSGATGLFLDAKFVRRQGLTTRPLTKSIPVFNIDGTPNKAGAISSVVDLVLWYRSHAERAVFAVTSLGKQDMILGFTWLWEHNSEVDWARGEVTMSRCPRRCATCAAEAKEAWCMEVQEHAAIRACCVGYLPYADLNLIDPPLLAFPCKEALYEDARGCDVMATEEGHHDFCDAPDPALPDKAIEVGDRVYATALHALPFIAEVRASQTTSQRLAQAFAANSTPWSFHDAMPVYLHDFEDVFSKASFDSLLERKQWDHAIELVPDSAPANCKVYPLAPKEQDELDAFLQENLDSGHIRPSKSPMASLVFFIKKKDGSLRLVQDYRVLNAMMVKPIPASPHHGAHKQPLGGLVLHQVGCLVGLQQCAHPRGRRVEGCIPDQPWTV